MSSRLLSTLLAVCVTSLLVPSASQANDFLGDLVYCDVDADGLFEPGDGDYGLDGVDVDIVCEAADNTECINLTTTTGALHSSVFRMEYGGNPIVREFPLHCPIAWDPFGDVTGRYLIELSDSCSPLPKPWTCTVTVDASTLPSDCSALVTPMAAGPPFDDGDGKYCDKVTDGPFPEGETLGNIHYAYEEATCLMFPDPAPGDGQFTVIIFPDNGGGQLSDFCAAYNDFGYTLGEECGNDIIEGDEQCDGSALGDCLDGCTPDCTCIVCGDDVADAGEECDGSDNSACDGEPCLPPGDPNECMCQFCGDGVAEGDEQCDGNDDSVCPGECRDDCICGVCGDEVLTGMEECDGQNDDACPGMCGSPGSANECKCPVCGDDVINQSGEECDGTADSACPGLCLPPGGADECSCPICGDGSVNQPGEECDGSADSACEVPGTCFPPGNENECMCPFCGDGEVNLPGEQCDPPNANEICNNFIDDDSDGLIDCDDVLDCPVGQETCGAFCETIMACMPPRNDPAKIRFGRNEGDPDHFRIHAQFAPGTEVDPPFDGFSIQITNEFGVVYSGSLTAGDLQVTKNGKNWKFRDRTVKRGRNPGLRDGLYVVKLRRKPNYVAFRARAFSDFSAATVPLMTTHVVIGNDGTAVTAEWREINRGWKLGKFDF